MSSFVQHIARTASSPLWRRMKIATPFLHHCGKRYKHVEVNL